MPAPKPDQSWKRGEMPVWEARWATLPAPARWALLKDVRLPNPFSSFVQVNPLNQFPPEMVQAWEQAGLILLQGPKAFVVSNHAKGFLTRIATIQRCALLAPDHSESRLYAYVYQAFGVFPLGQVVAKIVQHATGVGQYRLEGDTTREFVSRRFWPDWVANYLDDPLAKPLLTAIEQAEKSVLLSTLTELLPQHKPAAVRATLDRLVNHLALVEDLDPLTAEIRVGLLPAVVAARREKRERVVTNLKPVVPKEVGPDTGIVIPDLRAFLLEVAATPPLLKQNGSLYQKEEARFLEGFDPLPEWLLPYDGERAIDRRLATTFQWASVLKLAAATNRRSEAKVLQLTKAGQHWLTLDRESQFAEVAVVLRSEGKEPVHWGWHDESFLSSSIQVKLARGNSRDWESSYHTMMTLEDKQPLREALYRLLTELPVGQFFRVKDVLAWASEPSRNPLMLGRSPREVVIRVDHRLLPPIEEAVEEATAKVLHVVIDARLARLGCVQMGQDKAGEPLLARMPRLDVYFGKAAPTPQPVDSATRVVVQPDFTIIVIGLNPAPAAELAPFCDRARGSASQGSLTFRLTRESVLRAVAAGMAIEEMQARLERLSSKGLPKNVVTELRDWGGLVRKVQVQTAILFRCPDAATAQRVQGLLGKKAALAGETMVAWPADEKLTAALRKKLQEQGILVEVEGMGRGRSRR